MNTLSINLENCYGINRLTKDLDFTGGRPSRPKSRAYAIYAPNGVMKTSFSKTFEQLAKDELPTEERYGRTSSCIVEIDGTSITKEMIHVLKSDIDILSEGSAVTDILVNPASKARYDEILTELDTLKSKVLTALQQKSKVKKAEVEQSVLRDVGEIDLPSCIRISQLFEQIDFVRPYFYDTIFDPKALEVLDSPEFLANATEFNRRYQELFDQEGSIYSRGVFNPTKAEASFGTLDKQGFFSVGHKVHLNGDTVAIDKVGVEARLASLHEALDGDAELKKLRKALAKNAKSQALISLIESLPPEGIDQLLDKVKPENRGVFRKELWSYYLHEDPDAQSYLSAYDGYRIELEAIEVAAAAAVPRWQEAVDLFNDRFVNMPFTLSVANQADVSLGRQSARLSFTFSDGGDVVTWSRSEVKTLSQGEKRALYLLNFIFEVEARKLAAQKTLFIIDDAADSFDYKNKHAIVQYLEDLTKIDFFYQIILTHNFDLFRTLNNGFVHYERCLMANKETSQITLERAQGVRNIFNIAWKNSVDTDDCILCATIPFVRNLLEYTKGESDPDYLKLTNLLHWKEGTATISVGDYLTIYNGLFGSTFASSDDTRLLHSLLISIADDLVRNPPGVGLNLQHKVLLSIAIRMKAEMYLIAELRISRGEVDYWCSTENQFGGLMRQYTASTPAASILTSLEKVSITVSSNIHLNSFMYEPILDLTVDHLLALYSEIGDLPPTSAPAATGNLQPTTQ